MEKYKKYENVGKKVKTSGVLKVVSGRFTGKGRKKKVKSTVKVTNKR